MLALRFSQVDVFGASPFGGNPVAVVHEADRLSTGEMAAIARWTNLSETTFLLAPEHEEADYRVRIFTPAGELPFAGHPTLGSAHAWLDSGGRPNDPEVLVQECPAGLIPVRWADADRLAFAAPPLLRTGPVDAATLTRAVHAIGAAHDLVAGSRWADNGPGWLVLEITTPEALAALTPHPDRLEELAIGTFALTPGTPHLYEVRAFMDGIVGCEDPVTGSLNAGIAQELRREGRVPERYTVRQGTALGRDGIVSIEDDGRAIWVGGATTTLVSGSLTTR